MIFLSSNNDSDSNHCGQIRGKNGDKNYVLRRVILSADIAEVSFAFIIAETYITDLVWNTPFAHGQFAIVHHVIVCTVGLAIVFAL